MSDTTAPDTARDSVEGYLARIEVHLARLAQGHDPLGHLFAIERLARGARSERLEAQRAAERKARRP